MDRDRPSRTASLLERVSVALLLVTVAAAMLLGSGVAAPARAVLLFGAAAAMAAAVLAMSADGRFRFVRQPLWLLPLGVVALGVFQVVPLPTLPLGASMRLLPAPAPAAASLDRRVTIEAVLFAGTLFLLSFVAAHQVRTARRLHWTAGTLAVLLTAFGVIGVMQTTFKNSKFLGVLPVDQAFLPNELLAMFRPDSAIGPLAYHPWEQVGAGWTSDAEIGLWFAPSAPRRFEFAGFWQTSDWAACVLVAIPFLLAVSLRLARLATGLDRIEWFGQSEGQAAFGLLLLTFVLAALVGWVGKPLTSVAGSLIGWSALLFGCGSRERGRAFWFGGLVSVLTIVAAGAHVLKAQGVEGVKEEATRLLSEDQILLHLFRQEGLLGAGLGTLGEVWPLQRTQPTVAAPYASSLLGVGVEMGWLGMGLLAVAGLWVLGSFLFSRVDWDENSRTMLAGGVAALTAFVGVGLVGPGWEAPVVPTLAAVFLGCAARGLAMENAWSDGGVEA